MGSSAWKGANASNLKRRGKKGLGLGFAGKGKGKGFLRDGTLGGKHGSQ